MLPATDGDLVYIDHLQKKNAENLAFYPKAAFEREIKNFRILLAFMNNEPAGYLYHGSFDGTCKIHQACIEYDLRGQLYGAELINQLRRLCEVAGSNSITLRCGSDIEANGFWQAMGFYCEGVTDGGVRRMRKINAWRFDITPQLFEPRPVAPSDKKKDASIWQKRTVSAKNQFIRGAAMAAYRKAVLGDND